MDKEQFFEWFKEYQKYFNIKEVETFCEIKQGSLNRNLTDNRTSFRHSDKLLKFKSILYSAADK